MWTCRTWGQSGLRGTLREATGKLQLACQQQMSRLNGCTSVTCTETSATNFGLTTTPFPPSSTEHQPNRPTRRLLLLLARSPSSSKRVTSASVSSWPSTRSSSPLGSWTSTWQSGARRTRQRTTDMCRRGAALLSSSSSSAVGGVALVVGVWWVSVYIMCRCLLYLTMF